MSNALWFDCVYVLQMRFIAQFCRFCTLKTPFWAQIAPRKRKFSTAHRHKKKEGLYATSSLAYMQYESCCSCSCSCCCSRVVLVTNLVFEDSKWRMHSGLTQTANVAVSQKWQQREQKMRTSNTDAISYLLLQQLTSNKIAMRFFSRKRIFEIGVWRNFRTCNYSN